MNDNHEFFMRRCIELAASGLGNTSPNPMVGSVLVRNGKIVGEGYHRIYGQAHAEVNAIQSVVDSELLKNSTLYVNLEPCSHFGKTPPCAELIASLHIPRIVIGTPDPNPLVLGKGIEILKKAGCEVISGILPMECEELNKRFFTYHRQERPYIILKWAETADHFIDKLRTENDKPEWITNQACRILVHKWRSEEQAVMIATNTAIMDNPQLNVREWIGKNPVRIVLDDHLRLPHSLNIFDGTIKTIVYTYQEKGFEIPNVEYVKINPDLDKINFIFNHLYCNKILSIIVEGGAKFADFLIERNLWDEARIFYGKSLFHNGIKAPKLNLLPISENEIEGIALKYFKNNSQTQSLGLL